MNKKVISLLMICFVLQSCKPTLAFLMGLKKPHLETLEEQNKYFRKWQVKPEYSFYLKRESLDSLKKVPFKEGYKPSFRPIQFKIFDKSGKLVSHYANCEGPLQKINDSLPMRAVSLNKYSTLDQDLTMYAISESELSKIYTDLSEFDYIIVCYWAGYMGRMSKNLLKNIEKYRLKHKQDSRIMLIAINIGYYE